MDVTLELLPHQIKLMRSSARKSLLLCGRGAGKSYICAAMTLLALVQGRNVMLGGQRYDTLHDTIYAELKEMAFKWGIYDRIQWREAPMMMTFGDAHAWFATYASPEASRGYSRVSLLILDEMFLAPLNILSIWAPVMRANADGVRTRIIGATTPRPGSLWNIKFSDPDCDWEIIRASSMDNTRIKQEELDLILSTIDNDEQYRSEILGEIIAGLGNSAIIKLNEFPPMAPPTTDTRVIAGFDAGEGVERDASAFFKRRGNEVLEMWELKGINHEQCVRMIRQSNKALRIDKLNLDAGFSDYEFNILKYEFPCEQVNFARAATELNKHKYANVRAEMYFNLAHTIRRGLCVDGFDLTAELKRELCATGWMYDNQRRLLLTPKDELRLALGRSPDIADAAALTCLDRWGGDDPVMKQDRPIAGVSREDEEEIMSEY